MDKPATTGGAGVRKSTCFACGPSAHFEDSIVGPLHTNDGIAGPIILKGIYLDAGPLYTIRLILGPLFHILTPVCIDIIGVRISCS